MNPMDHIYDTAHDGDELAPDSLMTQGRTERRLRSWYRRLVGSRLLSNRDSAVLQSDGQRDTHSNRTIQTRVVDAGEELTFLRVPADTHIASLENGCTVTITVHEAETTYSTGSSFELGEESDTEESVPEK